MKSLVVVADQLAPFSSLNSASGWGPQAWLAEALLPSSQSPWIWERSPSLWSAFCSRAWSWLVPSTMAPGWVACALPFTCTYRGLPRNSQLLDGGLPGPSLQGLLERPLL